VAVFFECLVEGFSSLFGSWIAEFDISIAVFLRGDAVTFLGVARRPAFSSIDARRDWCHICWTIEDVCDLFLERRAQIVVRKVIGFKSAMEQLNFIDMIGIRFRDL